jgi:hypothetical protein
MMLGRRLLGSRVVAGRRLHSRVLQDAEGSVRLPRRPSRVANTDSDAATVPEVGWMWQAGGGTANKASATRANLKQANIKAKK